MAINKDFLAFIEISRIVAQVGFYSSAFFCFLLISLTLLTMKKRLGAYVHFVVIFSTVGIFFASLEFVLYPNIHSYNAGYFFYTTSQLFGFDRDTLYLFLAMYTGVYASTIAMLSVQFIYRYWAVFSVEKLRYFKGRWVLIWVIYCLIFGVLWTLGGYFFDKVDDYSKKYLRGVMKENYNLDMNEVAGMAVVAYGADGSPRYWNLMGVVNMSLIMAIQYAIFIYCAAMMHWNMEQKLRLMSTRRTNLHRQLYKTLVLQITAPSITLFAPIMFELYFPLLDWKKNFPTGAVFCTISLYPALDAIIIMCVVTDYRRSVESFVKMTLNSFHSWYKSIETENYSRSSNS